MGLVKSKRFETKEKVKIAILKPKFVIIAYMTLTNSYMKSKSNVNIFIFTVI